MTNINSSPENNKPAAVDIAAAAAQSAALSRPFAASCMEYAERGCYPLPIKAGTKKPFTEEWPKIVERPLDIIQLKKQVTNYPDANIGLVMGARITPTHQLACLDIDTDDEKIQDAILANLPAVGTRVAKRGKKGVSHFVLVPNNTKIKHVEKKLDLLVLGTQTLVPPSIHPETRAPYVWTTSGTLLNTPLTDLPILAHDGVERIVAAAGGIIPGTVQPPPRPTAESRPEVFAASPLPNGAGSPVNHMSMAIASKKDRLGSIENFRSAVAAIPPEEFVDRAKWVNFVLVCAHEAWWHPEHRVALEEICDTVSQAASKVNEKNGAGSKYDAADQKGTFEKCFNDTEKDEKKMGLDAMLGSGSIYTRAKDFKWVEAPEQALSQDADVIPANAGANPAITGEILPLQVDIRTKPPRPIANWYNTKLCLQAMGIYAWRDMFGHKNHIEGAIVHSDYVGERSDEVVIWVRAEIHKFFGFDPNKENIFDALDNIAEANRKNPIIDWLDGLVWDGEERMQDWLPRITGCKNEPLHCGVGQMLLLSMIVRARFPGTKYDTCVVLEGKQGLGKSSLARELAGGGEYFTDATNLLGLSSKERGELLAGCWVAELPELGGLHRGQIETVKAVLTQQVDHYRGAWKHDPKKQQRTCVFLATTNDNKYLEDITGSRRFVPVACCTEKDANGMDIKEIDIKKFRLERDQLFAEANDLVNRVITLAKSHGFHCIRGQELPLGVLRLTRLDERLWADVEAAGEKRRAISHEEIVLEEWQRDYLANPKALKNLNGKLFIPSQELHRQFPALPGGRVPDARRVAALMRKLGWEGDNWGNNAAGKRCRGFEKI